MSSIIVENNKTCFLFDMNNQYNIVNISIGLFVIYLLCSYCMCNNYEVMENKIEHLSDYDKEQQVYVKLSPMDRKNYLKQSDTDKKNTINKYYK